MKKFKNKQGGSVIHQKKSKFHKPLKPTDQQVKPNRKRKVLKNSPFKKLKIIAKLANTPKALDHKDESLQSLRPEKNKNKLKNVPVPKEILEKFSRGIGLDGSGIKTNINRRKLLEKEKAIEWAVEQSARTSVLLTEESGFLEADENEVTRQFSQKQLADSVDITSATKHFELNLEFGPYRMDYSRNGRFLLLGGRKGHIAAMDWVTKKLLCEMNVMEETFDVQWFHVETMFAVAQKEWVHIYDNQGIELHCLKGLYRVLRMEFLPYHFLLSCANENGYLSWLDVSMGKMVTQFNTNQGRLRVMAQNPYNAVLCLGHSKGIVTMWSPNVQAPLATMLCHKKPITSIAVDPKGIYMVTSSVDRSVRVWDVRNLSGPLQDYRMRSVVNDVSISQRGIVATASGNIVETYRDFCTKTAEKQYLKHTLRLSAENMQFCPFEDVLGVGSASGFTSLLVPGCGEPNFDALEVNPFQSKMQRREAEVKALLEKIQPEMITLDPTLIAEVDVPTLKDKLEAKKSLLHLKLPKMDFTPRKKKKHGNTVKMARTKKIVREEHKREFLKAVKDIQKGDVKEDMTASPKPKHVLDRFKPQIKSKTKPVPN